MRVSKIISLFIIANILGSCEQVFDKHDLEGIPGESVWDDLPLARAYVDKLYESNLPIRDHNLSDRSDESDGAENFMYGQLTENSVNYWPYSSIRNINVLLANIDDGDIDVIQKNRLKGEALFFRALRYFEMVRLYGGVPLILEPQNVTDDLLVERAPTSVVMDQIIADLDNAIANLPIIEASSGENDGHVHKGTAMAMKGRILLYYASPQFDPQQDKTDRWQEAYEANKAAKAQLINDGYGLYQDFGEIWYNEMNKEVIFVTRYEYPAKPDPTNYFAGTRPLDLSIGAAGMNQPILELVEAFPMKDGRQIDDPTSEYNYSSEYFWLDRDPRFSETIVHNGSLWELNGNTGRIQWTFKGGEENSPTETGFYCRKAVDPKLEQVVSLAGATDYVDMRFAEVLLNLAESANKVGNTSESYNELKILRARAGIDPGFDNMYGLETGMTVNEMHDAIIFERKIELAFEGKRYWDLRRNRMYENLLNGTRRKGHSIELLIEKDEFFKMVESMTTQNVLDMMETNYIDFFRHETINMDIDFTINWKPEYYFFAIPEQHLRLNSNLQQTMGWPGGTFNPLQ